MTATLAQRRVVIGSRVVVPTLPRETAAREITMAGRNGLALFASVTRAEDSGPMALSSDSVAGALRPRVLCVDDDHSIGETVQAILGDEGYDVTCLFEITDGAIRRAIGELKPDCVLLDSS